MGSLMPSMFAVTATCRLLYLEGSEIQYRNTDLTFRSANALLKFFGQRRPMLESVGRVCLQCGPAKHGLITAKTQNKAALRLLADHARRLVDLKLVFGPYWGMHSDRQLLSSYWYYSLYRLRPSVRLSLVVHPPYWKAPIGIEFLTDEAQCKLQRRVQSAENSFRQVLCQPESYRRGLSPVNAKDTIRSLKRATLPVACDLVAAPSHVSPGESQRA